MTATTAAVPVDVAVPDSHLDLLARPIVGVFTTMLPDGQPQSSLVWVDYDGKCACVNTTLERRKGRDLLANPRVSLLVVDPDDTSRFVQVRGDAELVTEGAEGHLDALTRRYTHHPVADQPLPEPARPREGRRELQQPASGRHRG